MDDDVIGDIVIYDFGSMAEIDDDLYRLIDPLLSSVRTQDVRSIVNILLDNKIIFRKSSRSLQDIEDFFAQVMMFLDGRSISDILSMVEELQKSMGDKTPPFTVRSNVLNLFKSLVLVDGLCRELDPSFSYINAIAQSVAVDSLVNMNFRGLLDRYL
jgi:predicted unusual protein kinase regulating ubiquinone biosynthesis (AarF/ABC1/UbiB family)